jgi:hypothetical protein
MGSSSTGGNGYNPRRERATHPTGQLTGGSERFSYSSSPFDFEEMLESLRELFEHDRQVASQPDSSRCGICYLYFPLSELHYRDEGFYVCPECEQALGKQSVQILRKQQKL